MKYILLLFVAMLQLPLFSQTPAGDANAVLDKAVANLKADVPVRMDYKYRVLDAYGDVLQVDKGLIYIDGDRYALLMQDMKVWCDGATQWSYMREINEVYVTDAVSDEAQNLSPLYVMEHYRNGHSVLSTVEGDFYVVTLQAADAGAESVVLHISGKDNRLVAMFINMPGQGCVEVTLDGYVSKCGVGDDTFVCPLDEFGEAEIIDMR